MVGGLARRGGTAYPSGGWLRSCPRGAAPRCPPGPGRGPGFLWKKAGGKNTREEEVLPPWTHLFWLGGPCGGPLFFSAWPAALYLTPVTARPPAGRAGRGWFCRREGSLPPPKAFPSGGRCPSAHTGADEGAIWYPTFPCRKKALSRLSPQRGFSIASLGNPVAPSSVTSGDSFPPRGSLRRWYVSATKSFLAQPLLPQKANPNQGTQMGTETAPPPEQCATTAKTSEWERAGHKPGGAGALPRDSLRPGFL